MNALVRILSLPACYLSRLPGCGPLVRACSTSVGQKILMAITGLSLCGFLVAHLAGNLKLFAGEQDFNQYAAMLHSLGPALAAAETGLFVVFVAHLGLALSTTAMSRAARTQAYEVRESKQGVFALPQGGASGWMLVTGAVVLVFLVCHLIDLRLKVNPFVDYRPAVAAGAAGSAGGHVNEFLAVRQVLTSSPSRYIYLLGLVALGIHLAHGVQSALQTLGISHRRWNPLFRLISLLFAWGIAVGFISLIAWAHAVNR